MKINTNAKKSNFILIEISTINSYHKKYANASVFSKALGVLAKETE